MQVQIKPLKGTLRPPCLTSLMGGDSGKVKRVNRERKIASPEFGMEKSLRQRTTSTGVRALQHRTWKQGRKADRESAVSFSSEESQVLCCGSQLVCCDSQSTANICREDV